MSLIEKYLGEGEEKIARFHKQLRQLFYFNSKNTSTTVNADNLKNARAIVKNSGVKQKLVAESEVSEVMGYTMKPKDKKLAMAFISGDAKHGDEGKGLFVDKNELRSGMATIATRDKKGYITLGTAYGNVTQTWINFVKKNTPKFWLK